MKKLGKNMKNAKQTLEAFGGSSKCICTCKCNCGKGPYNTTAMIQITKGIKNAKTSSGKKR